MAAECFLQLVELTVRVPQAFDGVDASSVDLNGERKTGMRRSAVDAHRAGAANAVLTPYVGAGHAERVGDRIRIWPAHVDPTVAYHERILLTQDDAIVDELPVDLRGW